MAHDVEDRVKQLCECGDVDAAATAALRGYGPEIFGFLINTLRDEHEAGEAFSLLSEDMWKGLASFAWRSSLRTWLYTLARHAAARHMRGPSKKHRGHARLSQISEVADQVRTRTLSFLRTEAKDKLSELRAELTIDEQMLLTLRIDRKMEWLDIARIMNDGELDDAKMRTSSARLRKRFQLLKDRLRERADELGMLVR